MKLAVLGASARAAACSALDAGCEVVAADLFADSDLAERCPATRITDWPNGFVEWLCNQQVDGWLYTGGLENYPQLIDRLHSVQPLLGNHGPPLRAARDIAHLRQLLSNAGLPRPESRTTAPETADGWLLKSPASAGGLGVKRWQGEARFSSAYYWQRFIEGRAISAAYVATAGQVELLGVTEQLIGRPWTHARDFQYAGSVGVAGGEFLHGRTTAACWAGRGRWLPVGWTAGHRLRRRLVWRGVRR